MERNWAYITPESIAWARRKSGMTYALIAKRMRVGVEQLRLWERGAKRPTFDQAIKFAKVTDTPFGYLFLSAHNIAKLPQTKAAWEAVHVVG